MLRERRIGYSRRYVGALSVFRMLSRRLSEADVSRVQLGVVTSRQTTDRALMAACLAWERYLCATGGAFTLPSGHLHHPV